MESQRKNQKNRVSVYWWPFLVTVITLLIPLSAMQLTDQVNWDRSDFIVMAVLIFCLSSLCAFISNRIAVKYRMAVIAAFVVAFLYLWAELAVGVFTAWGS